MQKRKNNGFYVLLMLLSMVGIGCIMGQKEWSRETAIAYESSRRTMLAVQPFLELGSRIKLENEYMIAENIEQPEEDGEANESSSEIVEEVMKPPYTIGVTDTAYFDDALFIGDSRTVGIAEYGYLTNADFFADVSMSVYKVENKRLSIEGEKRKLAELLSENTYGKIYVMLGINELGYDFEYTVEKYCTLLDTIQVAQPDAIIYICANLHVTKKQSEKDKLFNNVNIDHFNEAIAQMADGEKRFYIDVNEIFDDAEGNLSEEFSSDEAHVMGKYYADWCDWLMTQAIVITS